MSKYAPLKTFLAGSAETVMPMTFSAVAQILATKLPNSAFIHQAWWSNHGESHVHAQAWLEAGFKTEQVDLRAQTVVFRRAAPATVAQGVAEASKPFAGPSMTGSWIDRARAKLRGTVRVAPGYDLTQPYDEAWDAETR